MQAFDAILQDAVTKFDGETLTLVRRSPWGSLDYESRSNGSGLFTVQLVGPGGPETQHAKRVEIWLDSLDGTDALAPWIEVRDSVLF